MTEYDLRLEEEEERAEMIARKTKELKPLNALNIDNSHSKTWFQKPLRYMFIYISMHEWSMKVEFSKYI